MFVFGYDSCLVCLVKSQLCKSPRPRVVMCYKCGFTVFSVTGTQVSGQMQNGIEDIVHNGNILLTELTTSVGFA